MNIIGYDARIQLGSKNSGWTKERRSRYLLRELDAFPLSVDVMVWPSIFDHGIGFSLEPEHRSELGLTGLGCPDWIGHCSTLWEDLEALKRHLALLKVEPEDYTLIAVSEGVFEGDLSITGFAFMGFDIADESLLSGLANCAYGNNAESERNKWADHLNEYHLFPNFNIADTFRSFTDRRVPEHAPFNVFGVLLASCAGPAALDRPKPKKEFIARRDCITLRSDR